MTKLYPPDAPCKSIEVEGARTGLKRQYDQQSDGAFHVENKNHIKALRAVGCFAQVTRMPGKGYRCQGCNFLAVFKSDPCSRCGGTDLVLEEN